MDIEKKTDIVIGEALKIGNRTLYPVVQVSTLNVKKGVFIGGCVLPIAIVIVEPTLEYVISLTEEKLTLEKLFQIAPSFKEKIKTK